MQIRKIIQMKSDGYSEREISEQTHTHRKTVRNYIQRARDSGQSLQSLLQLDDSELGELVLPARRVDASDNRPDLIRDQIDYYRKELKRTGVTRHLLWQEYLAKHSEGCSYSWFCEQLARHLKSVSPSYHEEKEPGKLLEFDFAGKSMTYVHPISGQQVDCPTLVVTMVYSNLTYVEPLETARLEDLIPGLNRMLAYFGGVPREASTDNMRQIVTRSCRYEPTFTQAAEAWAIHNGFILKATRPRKPKDKPSVEKHVDIVYTHIYAPLRNLLITSREQLVKLTMERLDVLNNLPRYKDLPSRWQLFLKDEKPLLRSLPHQPFALKKSTLAKVKMDYHVILGEDWHQYSVPWEYIGQQTRIIYDGDVVEVFIGLKRIAIHQRDRRKNRYTTLPEHMPESHRQFKKQRSWNSDDYLEQASRIGEETVITITQMLASRFFPEQTYDACLGILRLAQKYGNDRLEAACRRGNQGIRITYHTIANILKNNLDQASPNLVQPQLQIPEHDNIRGAKSFS